MRQRDWTNTQCECYTRPRDWTIIQCECDMRQRDYIKNSLWM
jgi:hypothetical protein